MKTKMRMREERRGEERIVRYTSFIYTYHGRILIQRRRRRRRMVRDQRSRSTGFCWKGRGKSRNICAVMAREGRQFEEKKGRTPLLSLFGVSWSFLFTTITITINHDNKRGGTQSREKSTTEIERIVLWKSQSVRMRMLTLLLSIVCRLPLLYSVSWVYRVRHVLKSTTSRV